MNDGGDTMTTTTFDDLEPMEDGRYIPLVVLGSLSSSLSILGSSCIIYMSLQSDIRNQIIQRLLFCLSAADLVCSTACLVMPFMVPSYLGLSGAVGNQISCSLAGFFFLNGSKLGCYYNTFLSVCFFLMVGRNWREHDFTWPIEMGAHLLAWTIAYSLDVVAVVTQSINPAPAIPNLCVISTYPWTCDTDDDGEIACERSSPETMEAIQAASVSIYLLFSMLGFLCTGLTWRKARSTFQKSSTYRFESSVLTTSAPASSFRTTTAMQQSVTTNNSRKSGTSVDDPNQERIRQVGIQALLYSLAYLNTFCWPMISMIIFRALSSDDTTTSATDLRVSPRFYPVQFLFWMLFPLQGAFNFFIYTRVKVNQWREVVEPNKSIFWIYKQTIACTPIPSKKRRSRMLLSGNNNKTSDEQQSAEIEGDNSREIWRGDEAQERSVAFSPLPSSMGETSGGE